ncbi:unnamed protein product, partial [Rotaria sp. Silwood2]
KFDHFNFLAPRSVSFTLNIRWGSNNGTTQQCLTYCYYLSNIIGAQHNIKICKEEREGSSEIINNITNSPFNGCVERQIYYDFEKTSGLASHMTTIAIDEILIRQGSFFDESVTQNTTTTLTTSIISTTTDVETKTRHPPYRQKLRPQLSNQPK